MNSYLITYDLSAPGRDYKDLFELIKRYNKWAKPLESVWIVKTTESATNIRDNLKTVMDSNDKLLVVKLSDTAAWKGLSSEMSNWIKNNL